MKTKFIHKTIWIVFFSFIASTIPALAFPKAGIAANVRFDEKTQSIIFKNSDKTDSGNITVKITDPNGELCYADQLTNADDGSSSIAYKIKNKLNGTYTVSVNRGDGVSESYVCNVDYFKNAEVSEVYYNTDENEICSEIFPNGNINAKIDVTNNSDSDLRLNIYNAKFSYDKNIFKNANTNFSVIKPQSSTRISAAFDTLGSEGIYRSFIWDSSLLPIKKVAEYTYADMFTKGEGVYREFAPGTIRPDEGTIEFTANITKPISEFGIGYDFFFSVLPISELPNGGTTLFGLFIPALPQKSLTAVLREKDGNTNYLGLPLSNFNYTPGEKFNIALSWKAYDRMNLYINGNLVASAALKGELSEENLPYSFCVQKGEPFNISKIRVSTKALSRSALASNPEEEFKQEDNTVLIVNDNMTKRTYYKSTWIAETGYKTLLPAMRSETQCYTLGENVYYYFAGINHSTETVEYPVNINVYNSAGEMAASVNESIQMPADGVYHVYRVKFKNLGGADIYTVRTSIDNENTYESRISVLPANDNSVPDGKYADSYGQDVEYDMSAEQMKKLNVSYTRNQSAFAWFTVEPQNGVFNWSITDEYVKRCKENGIKCLGVLGKWPNWAAQEPTAEEKEKMQTYHDSFVSWKPKDNQQWREYVYQTVNRYKDDVKHWEIINEVNYKAPYNAASFTGTNEEYAELLKIAYEAAKEADPDCVILTSGFAAPVKNSGVDTELPMMITDAQYSNGYYDVYNVHGYNGVKIWEDEFANLKANNPSAEIWMSEYMPTEIVGDKEKAISNIINEIDFLNSGAVKYFNMGSAGENFIDEATQSPTACYQATGVFQNSIRKCDELLDKYKFAGDEIFSVKDCFKRTDGKYLSVFVSSVADELKVNLNTRIIEAYDLYGRRLSTGNGGVNSQIEFNSGVYIISDAPLDVENSEFLQKNLFSNSSFEIISGEDITDWRKGINDGVISASAGAYTGEMAVSIKSNSADKNNYVFQDVAINTAGTYEFSAKVKNVGSEPVKVMLRLFDRDNNQITDKTFNITPGGNYTEIKSELAVSRSETASHAFIIGLQNCMGEILVDDVKLLYKNK